MRLFWLASAALVMGACGLGFNPDLPSGSTSSDDSDPLDSSGDGDAGGGFDIGGEGSEEPRDPANDGGAGGMNGCETEQQAEMGGAPSEGCR